jgi:hypothetical protein
MDSRHEVPAAPPRDALLKDRHGQVWAALGEDDQWVRLAGAGHARTASWAELVTEHGPVDVMVWRGTITSPARAALDEQASA